MYCEIRQKFKTEPSFIFDRVLNTPLKTFHSFVKKRAEAENPPSVFAVEGRGYQLGKNEKVSLNFF